ncbi:hypothetical protein U1Q18_016916 [Sarracenia purpurea var. burkii]
MNGRWKLCPRRSQPSSPSLSPTLQPTTSGGSFFPKSTVKPTRRDAGRRRFYRRRHLADAKVASAGATVGSTPFHGVD